MTKNLAQQIISQAKKKKSIKILKGYYLEPDLIIQFEKKCDSNGLKYSRVIEELITAFLSAESK